MEKKNHYLTLELQNFASKDEINKSFKSLKKKYHPDKAKSPEQKEEYNQKFVEISASYKYLSENKEQYDLYLSGGFQTINEEGFDNTKYSTVNKEQGFNREYNPEESFVSEKISFTGGEKYDKELILNLMKNESFTFVDLTPEEEGKQIIFKNTRKRKPDTSRLQLNLTEKEMREGTVVKVNYFASRICQHCYGEKGSVCNHCNNSRVYTKEKILLVKIPPTRIGKIYTIQSRGVQNPLYKGTGDVELEIIHNDLDWYEEKNKMTYDLHLTKEEAKKGGIFSIPYFDNEMLNINIPSGVKHNTRLKIRNKGIEDSNHKNKDLIVKIKCKKSWFKVEYIALLFLMIMLGEAIKRFS